MSSNKWMVYTKRAPFQEIAKTFTIDQVTARILRNRDVCTDEEIQKFLYGTIEDLYASEILKNASKAAELIFSKIQNKSRIRVIGDYDIDGISAVYILCTCMKALGADVDYSVPERMRDGYGLNERLIEESFAAGVDTIVTCDNGISAIDQIRYAKRLGMTVIVTDHHRAVKMQEHGKEEYSLPPADIIVDPHLPGETMPFKDICGAVVAWKIMLILLKMGEAAGNIKETETLELRNICLQFAAIATVGDVMPLRDENHLIVKFGLKELERTEHVGLKCLIEATGVASPIKSHDIGFVLGPCMNAGGRLETAASVLELLYEKDPHKAGKLAAHLVALNEERKGITNLGLEEAIRQIEEDRCGKKKVLVIYLPNTHESVAGIIAGKVKEYYNHPAFVLTDSQTPGLLKGSGRSVENYIMHEALGRCADILCSYGGHPMAAGLSLKKENLGILRERLNDDCELQEDAFIKKIMIDVPMPIGYVTLDLIHEFSKLEPFGVDNPHPLFAEKDVQILNMQILGRNRNVLKLRLRGDRSSPVDAVLFGEQEIGAFMEYLETKYSPQETAALMSDRNQKAPLRLSILYEPRINSYMNMESVQLILKDYH